jgi:HD superfamily phosphohydrolase
MPQFRDPVHGFIYVSENEQKIIDAVPFQRLRNIHQLATAYLVYHGAEHTRFGHSIGVMHLVTQVFDSVVAKNSNLFREDPQENAAFIKWYRQILRLIALTHDLGHAPFSHASEELFYSGYEHENYTQKIIQETVIADYINEIGEKLHTEIATELERIPEELTAELKIRPITPELLWMIYGEKPRINDQEYIWPDFVFLKSFMDSELDCDKMDYLLRDSLYCGVSYGKYDLDRFISTLTAYKSEDTLSLSVSSGGIQAFEEFVLARYFMFIQVYFHKTRRYLDHLLIKSLQEILPNGKYPEKTEEYLKWDDIRVIHTLQKLDPHHPYLHRRVMSCIFETPAHTTKAQRMVAKSLFDQVQIQFPNALFHFDDSIKAPHKLLPTIYSSGDDSGKHITVIDKYTSDVKNIMDSSPILNSICSDIYICRIYAQGENVDKIRQWVNHKYDEYSK